jgi:hypothetical protein
MAQQPTSQTPQAQAAPPVFIENHNVGEIVLTLPGAVELQQKLSAVLTMLQQSMAQQPPPVSAAGPKPTK